MSMTVACPSCDYESKVSDDFLGKKVKCPKCDAIHTVDSASFPGVNFPPPPVRRAGIISELPPENELLFTEEPEPEGQPIEVDSQPEPSLPPWTCPLIGLVGSALLILGTFVPLISVPILGNMNYIQNGQGDGIFILVLAGISAFLAFMKWFRGLWATGLLSLALLAFTFTILQVRMAEAGALGFALIQLQWGWAVLGIGAVLVVAAAIVAEVLRTPLHANLIKIIGALSIPVTLGLSGFSTVAVPAAFKWVGEEAARTQREAAEKADKEAKAKAAKEAAEKRAAQEEAERKAAHEAAEFEAAKQKRLKNATMQALVPILDQGIRHKSGESPEWADASAYAVRQADILVTVVDLKQTDGLLIELSVKNLGANESIEFGGWGSRSGNAEPLLENDLRQTLKPANSRTIIFAPQLLAAGKSVTNLLLFDASIENLSFLRLELPASAFGGYGKLRLHIPKSMIFFKAAQSLGPKAVPPLINLLQDKEPNIRIGAASTLGRLGTDGASAVPSIAKALKDPDIDVRTEAGKALATIGTSSRKALSEMLEAMSDPNDEVRLAVEAALGQLDTLTIEEVPVLINVLRNPNVDVRYFAVKALGKIGPEAESAVPALIQALRDSDDRIRAAAAGSLGKIGRQAKSAIPALAQTLKDRNNVVRQSVTESLIKMRTEPEATPALIDALKDHDDTVFGTAAKALGQENQLNKDHVPLLVEVLKLGNSKAKIFTIRSLGNMGADAKGAVSSLIQVLRDPDELVRQNAAVALGRIGPKAWSSAGALGEALSDESRIVRREAVLALGKISGPDANAAVPSLIKCLKDKSLHDDSVSALVKIGKGAVPSLISSLEGTKDFQQRSEFISLLGQIGPEASEAISILTSISTDSNSRQMRTQAQNALKKIQEKK